ncbi:MAG: hypothetical protein AAB463_01260 [Patescibacteria group bacterium]
MPLKQEMLEAAPRAASWLAERCLNTLSPTDRRAVFDDVVQEAMNRSDGDSASALLELELRYLDSGALDRVPTPETVEEQCWVRYLLIEHRFLRVVEARCLRPSSMEPFANYKLFVCKEVAECWTPTLHGPRELRAFRLLAAMGWCDSPEYLEAFWERVGASMPPWARAMYATTRAEQNKFIAILRERLDRFPRTEPQDPEAAFLYWLSLPRVPADLRRLLAMAYARIVGPDAIMRGMMQQPRS